MASPGTAQKAGKVPPVTVLCSWSQSRKDLELLDGARVGAGISTFLLQLQLPALAPGQLK
jgi:hypothetical protein